MLAKRYIVPSHRPHQSLLACRAKRASLLLTHRYAGFATVLDELGFWDELEAFTTTVPDWALDPATRGAWPGVTLAKLFDA